MAEEIRTLPSGVQYKVIDGAYVGLVQSDADITALTNTYNQTEDMVSALDEVVQTEKDSYTYSGDKTGKTVTFDDGSVLTQKGFNFQYEDADGNPLELDTAGIKQKSNENKNDALRNVVGDIKQNLTEEVYEDFGGKDGALVSEYLADQQAIADQRASIDERKDADMFGKGGTMDQLNEQVQREADALGISTDEYYSLGMPLRGQMAISDIGELFTETPGDAGYFARVGPDGQPVDKDGNPVDFGGLGLGTLGSENLAIYQDKAQEIIDKKFGEVDPNIPIGLGGDSGVTQTDLGPYVPETSDFEIFGDTGKDIYTIGGVQIGPGGGGGGGDSGGGGNGGGPGVVVVPPVVPPVVSPEVPGGIGVGVPVIGPGVIGGGTGGTGGGGIGSGVPVAGTMPDPSTYIVPSTANYGTDERFKDLAPTFDVSKAAMPIFNRNDPAPSIPPVSAGQPLPEGYKIIKGQVYQDPNVYAETDAGVVGTQLALNPVGSPPTSLLAEGGIVSLAGGGTPKGQGITPDFMVDTYYPSLIPKALDGNKAARNALLEAHSNFDNFTLPEELLLRIKYSSFQHGGVAERGYSHDGIGTLNATARNMFRPMVS